MPRVDFYLVGDGSPGAAAATACRLVEKAWLAGHRVYLRAASTEAAARLDETLWTFRQDSFVPHGRYPEQGAQGSPVLVGYGADPEGFGDVVVNLAADVPPFHARLSRVLEVVPADADAREAARARYRFYQQEGYSLQTHEV